MKKIFCFLMAVLLLLSCGISGYAEGNTLTADLVLQRLAEGEDTSETSGDQAANGALRLAEMLVALDTLSIETQEEADHLNRILDKLVEIDVPDESIEHKLAMGLMKTFEALIIFQQQADQDGAYEEELQQIYDSFVENDDKADGAKQQAVNGLYHSVLAASLIVRGFSRNEAVIRQIEEELAAFDEADKNHAETDVDQLLLGSETLFRMLTALASVLDADGSFSAELREISENTYVADDQNGEATFRLANWLYGCVYMTDVIVGEIEA